jgi:hemerythrin-like domain-containing protein
METTRRKFIETGLKLTFCTVAGTGLLTGCVENESDDEGQSVSPPEDLMQEHGLLNRILLIYDSCKINLRSNISFPVEALGTAAGIIRAFVEDYHEKQEEKYLFPRFQKANTHTDLVQTLVQQHHAGRRITDRIIQLVRSGPIAETEKQQLILLLERFNSMYRPHEAREDTVLFPAFRRLVSKHEYDSLGEEFEKNEHRLFGADGFEGMVNKVADIEKRLDIYDLGQFTPGENLTEGA